MWVDRPYENAIDFAITCDIFVFPLWQLKLSEDPQKMTTNPNPGTLVYLKATGEPGSSVGLLAVDKGVLVLSKKNRMSQAKVGTLAGVIE